MYRKYYFPKEDNSFRSYFEKSVLVNYRTALYTVLSCTYFVSY